MQYPQFIVVACAAFLANGAGGLFARRVTDRRHLALGFSAGTVSAAAFFVFLPRAMLGDPKAHGADQILPLVGLGFVIALLLDRLGSFRIGEGEGHGTTRKHHVHGVLNGAAAGMAYQVSPAIGGIAAAALLVHEFSDSADAMREALHHGLQRPDLRSSCVSSLCFAAGLAATGFWAVTPALLSAGLALFGGYFIYLSASELIPESHHRHPQLLTVAMTFGGAGALYLAGHILGL